MQDRRKSERHKVFLGGVAEVDDCGPTLDCVVRNMSDHGACVEIDAAARMPDQLKLSVPTKGRSFLARLIWRQANLAGLALHAMVTDPPESDLDARLRRSVIKKRELQRRIDELIGGG